MKAVGAAGIVICASAFPAHATESALPVAQQVAGQWKGLPKASVVKDPVIRKQLSSKRRLRHTVAIVPMYDKTKPERAVTRSMARNAERLYEREIPGFKWRTTIAKPMKVSNLCRRGDRVSVASRKANINWQALGNHLVAYAPECQAGAFGLYANGWGWIRVNQPDPAGTALAHEMGHNFNMDHANLLFCRKGKKDVSLSRNCREREYRNYDDVMGGVITVGSFQAPATERRIGPVWQAELTGRARVVKPGKRTTITLASTGARGKQVAVVRSKFGAIYFGARQNEGSSAVVAEVVTRGRSGGAARLSLVEATNLAGTSSWDELRLGPLPALGLGSSWAIPGSPLRVTVIDANKEGATLRFTPKAKADEAEPAPVSDVRDDQSEDERFLRWTPIDGAIAYIVRAGNEIVARSGAGASETNISSVPWWTDKQITITAVSRDGAESTPTVVSVSPPDS